MSKLDRQLDDFFGEKRVEIHWPSDEEVDVELLRLRLVSEIDSHRSRVPIDLRRVNGAPDALVDLLLEMQRYAMSQTKILSISASLPEMQEALNPRRRRKSRKSDEPGDEMGTKDASEVATSAIQSQSSLDVLRMHAIDERNDQRVNQRRSKRRRNTGKDYAILASLIAGTLAIVLVGYFLFLDDGSDAIIIPNAKSFEHAAELD